jgi:hypothetical protein
LLREGKVPAERFVVQTIPDIFIFARQRREIFRHVGFLPERVIEKKMIRLGMMAKGGNQI